MNDVLERLAALHTDSPHADPAAVAGDLARGRRALARRRKARGATAVAVLAVAGVAGTTLAARAPSGTDLDLVAYDGRQLPGFTVEKVPEGFVLQGASSHSLAVARPDNRTTIDDFEDKIVVMLEPTESVDDRAAASPEEKPVKVTREGDRMRIEFSDGRVRFVEGDTLSSSDLLGGDPAPRPSFRIDPFEVDGDAATLRTNPDSVKVLEYEHGDVTVVVQMWSGLGLTDAELREFADGIAVTDEAQVSVG